MSNTFDKLSVLDSFIEEVNSYLPEIEANLERLTQSPGDMEALEETHRRTHTIGGSASMMDFPGMAHIAHGMEDILGDVVDGLAHLDQPTIAFLQRSLGRLHRLVDGIRHGVDENAVMAEDDRDYAQYRAQQEKAVRGASDEMATPEPVHEPQGPTSPPSQSGAEAISSLDEMLSSFRTPPAGDASWPEEPVLRAAFPPRPEISFPVPPMQPAQHAHFEAQLSHERPVPPPSALELLAGSAAHRQQLPQMPPTPQVPPIAPLTPRPLAGEEMLYSMAGPIAFPPMAQPPVQQAPVLPVAPAQPTQPEQALPGPAQMSPAFSGALPPLSQYPQMSPTFSEALPQQPQDPRRNVIPDDISSAELVPQEELALPQQIYQDLQGETHALEDQAAFLKRTLSQLRIAAEVIEAQRTEFKGFLDGSRDALDRMEDWAGKAMGLNLRNSPEQVRRYLPLSVMWVANSKLKKVLDMLLQMAAGVEGTDEQMQLLFQQLHSSLFACGEIFQQLSEAPDGMIFRQEAGWSPWDMQASSDRAALRERVTFERQGDVTALRAEIENELRAELRIEYENRPATLAARAEMQHQIREELREEFEAKQRLQERVAGVEDPESLQALEKRLRNEIEIQVRSEFLSRLEEGGAALINPMDMQDTPAAQVSAPMMPLARPVMPPALSQTRPLASSQTAVDSFADEATEIFRLEAEEHLQTISMYVAALEHAPTNLEPIQGIRRATHTLKGAAGMMGFRAIADLCHVSEDMLDGIMEGTVSISPNVLSLILDTAEALDSLINGKGATVQNEQAVQSLRMRYAELLGEQASLSEEEIEFDDEQEIEHVSMASVVDNASQRTDATMPGMVRSDLSVRVSLSKLDELVNLFGELLVNRTILEERIQRLNRLVVDASVSSARLRDVGQRLESRFEAATLPSGRSVQVMPGEGDQSQGLPGKNGKAEPAHLAEFDELELDRYTEFHQLARGLSEGISDMTTLSTEMETIIRDAESSFGRESRLSTTFQDRLMKARLVPLSTMIPRLYRTARAVALKQHKEFELVLEGQETEVDRTVIEEVAGPLLHLMRNAVNHALETPEMRLQRGKPSAGQIKLSAAYEGNLVVITVRDDGIGLDPERIRNEAIARGLIHPNQALDNNEIVELIFRPGFSTAEVLSEESGRGVGLDVVRDSVSRLRGSLEVESMPGQGTAFTMKFPTSLAIQNAMMVKVADQQFAIPTVMVEAIGRLDNFKHSNYGGRPSIVVQNQHYPLSSLAQLLNLPVSELNDKAPILLVHTDRSRVALVVDDIRGRMDVVIKNLGPHLRSVHGIAGGTVLGNGRVVLILEVPELLSARSGLKGVLPVPPLPNAMPGQETPQARVSVERRTTIAPVVPAPKPTEAVAQGKYILVVDDSPSVRRVVGNMLKQHNWEVQTARDGVEAFEMITKETPAAALLDIEMPRMDGFELVATLRAQEQYRTLPLIMLTSRAGAKHQQRAMQLGASAYVVKPYQDEELINILNALVYGASV